MKIGISSPVTLTAFLPFLDPESAQKAQKITGLKAPAVDALITGLLNAGHEVVVFTLDPDIRHPEILAGKNLKIYIGKYRSRGFCSGWLRAATFFQSEINSLRKFIRQEADDLDILHAHWSYEFAIAGLNCKVPMCVTFRDYAWAIYQLRPDFYRFIRLLMNRYVVSRKKSYQAIANSGHIHDLLQKKWALDSEVVPNPIHPAGFVAETELPEYRKNRRIVSISNGWGKLKNIETLLAAFSLLKKELPDAELELVGSCFRRGDADTERIFREHPEWTENVIFAGAIPHDDLGAEIRNCSLLVHPSREESFGNILLEAMGQGIPVIGGKNSGAVPYVLDGGRAGMLCDINDPAALKEAMVKMITEEKLWMQYSRTGYNHVKEHFTLEKIIPATVEIYQRTIEKNSIV